MIHLKTLFSEAQSNSLIEKKPSQSRHFQTNPKIFDFQRKSEQANGFTDSGTETRLVSKTSS